MFSRYLELSDQLRPNYSASLGVSSLQKKDTVKIGALTLPDFLCAIYSKVNGTVYELKDQTLMDFIPGYRLIHIDEYSEDYINLKGLLNGDSSYFPFLGNYSNDYICWKEGEIFAIYHDDPIIYKLHNSEKDFYKTITDFYTEDVYFIDKTGFLNYDFEKQEAVGKKNNPNISYWQN